MRRAAGFAVRRAFDARLTGSPWMDCYILNLSHAKHGDRYISLWRPECKGYAWPLPWAGRYPEDLVRGEPDYYNSGDNIAVPSTVVEALAAEPRRGDVDGDVGPVVLASRENWKVLLAAAIAPPTHPQRFSPRSQGMMYFAAATRRPLPESL